MAETDEGTPAAEPEGPALGTDLYPAAKEQEGVSGGQEPAAKPVETEWDPNSVTDWLYVNEEQIPEHLRDIYRPVIDAAHKAMSGLNAERERIRSTSDPEVARLTEEVRRLSAERQTPAETPAPRALDDPNWKANILNQFTFRNQEELGDAAFMLDIIAAAIPIHLEGRPDAAALEEIKNTVNGFDERINSVSSSVRDRGIDEECAAAYGKYGQAEVDQYANAIAGIRGQNHPTLGRLDVLKSYELLSGKASTASAAAGQTETQLLEAAKKNGGTVSTPVGAVTAVANKGPLTEAQADAEADRLLGA